MRETEGRRNMRAHVQLAKPHKTSSDLITAYSRVIKAQGSVVSLISNHKHLHKFVASCLLCNKTFNSLSLLHRTSDSRNDIADLYPRTKVGNQAPVE